MLPPFSPPAFQAWLSSIKAVSPTTAYTYNRQIIRVIKGMRTFTQEELDRSVAEQPASSQMVIPSAWAMLVEFLAQTAPGLDSPKLKRTAKTSFTMEEAIFIGVVIEGLGLTLHEAANASWGDLDLEHLPQLEGSVNVAFNHLQTASRAFLGGATIPPTHPLFARPLGSDARLSSQALKKALADYNIPGADLAKTGYFLNRHAVARPAAEGGEEIIVTSTYHAQALLSAGDPRVEDRGVLKKDVLPGPWPGTPVSASEFDALIKDIKDRAHRAFYRAVITRKAENPYFGTDEVAKAEEEYNPYAAYDPTGIVMKLNKIVGKTVEDVEQGRQRAQEMMQRCLTKEGAEEVLKEIQEDTRKRWPQVYNGQPKPEVPVVDSNRFGGGAGVRVVEQGKKKVEVQVGWGAPPVPVASDQGTGTPAPAEPAPVIPAPIAINVAPGVGHEAPPHLVTPPSYEDEVLAEDASMDCTMCALNGSNLCPHVEDEAYDDSKVCASFQPRLEPSAPPPGYVVPTLR